MSKLREIGCVEKSLAKWMRARKASTKAKEGLQGQRGPSMLEELKYM